ncbi:MAG TPA: Ig domain-containing protein, partial [Paludibacter sp.]
SFVAAATSKEDVVFTDYQPAISEVVDNDGFKHPGVGLTKELLENVRQKVRQKIEPWNTYFNAMLECPAASRSVSSKNQNASDPTKPLSDAFDSQPFNGRFIGDGLTAYTQALLYFISGDEQYRRNAMHIIRIWSQMDISKYKYFSDAHIHTGIPLNRMVMAAEILRYTDCQSEDLKWTENDTKNFVRNLITPVIENFQHSPNRFMNQHLYPLIGSISGYIFTGNRSRYNEAVEWYTVNSTANNQGFNGSIKQLFRWVDQEDIVGKKVGEGNPVPGHVQHVEMGRDQAHGGGDLTNTAIINRLLLAQGTKVDPLKGTASTSSNAVGPYEFLNDRMLAAANYFWQFMLGYDTPWTPVAYSISPEGVVKDTYNSISANYKGRFQTANFWDFYAYYTYTRKVDVSKIAPYYYEAFTKKLTPDGPGWKNVDGGTDFWLYLPKEAEKDAITFLPNNKSAGTLLELEDRYTKLDTNSATIHEGATSFIRFNATETGSKIAILSFGNGEKRYGVRFRTNGVARLSIAGSTVVLPDTGNEWKYVAVNATIGNFEQVSVVGEAGVIVDIDHINTSDEGLKRLKFKSGELDLKFTGYVGQPIRFDFSSNDSIKNDSITYKAINLPKGATFDVKTGELKWSPRNVCTTQMTVVITDGTTFVAKNVFINITHDRASAIKAIASAYDSAKIYSPKSVRLFNERYKDAVKNIKKTKDAAFSEKLTALTLAAQNLKLTTPLCADDGSIDYSQKVVYSTCGKELKYWLDGVSSTFVGFYLAPKSYHILDFGADCRVSATAFGFQSNIFADRTAGSVVFGSNDNENWIRITSQETAFTKNFQKIQVDDKFKNSKFRYLKIEKIHRYPDLLGGNTSHLFELSEFRIYGQCHEIE